MNSASRMPEGFLIQLTYEELVTRPREVISRVNKFLGLPPLKGVMVDSMMRTNSHSHFPVGRSVPEQLKKWKATLSQHLISLIETTCTYAAPLYFNPSSP
jgi:hypothetical protein